jgi:uncharacterized protein RhaS with RHS repeats
VPPETGLGNGIVRGYDPTTGRWLSNDPIGISGGVNQYVAFNNAPLEFSDPWGLLTSEERRDILRQIQFMDAMLRSLKFQESLDWQGEVRTGGRTYMLPLGFSFSTISPGIPNGYVRNAMVCHEAVHRRQWKARCTQRWSHGFLRGMRLTEWYAGRLVDMTMPSYEIEAYTASKEYLEAVLEDPKK